MTEDHEPWPNTALQPITRGRIPGTHEREIPHSIRWLARGQLQLVTGPDHLTAIGFSLTTEQFAQINRIRP